MNFKQNHIKMSTPEEFSALKSRIRGKFRDSVHHLSARCLQKAATWTSEQILGMDDTDDQRSDFMQRCDPYRGIPMRHIDSLMMARLLLAGGEYQRCAYFVRSRQIGSFDSKDQGERKAARMGLFLSSYARYLAGEKLKEQLSTEVAAEGDKAEVVLNADGTPVSPKPARKGKAAPATETERRYASKNCNLQSLCDDLSAHYSEGHMRGDGFLLYIYAVVARDLRRQQGLPVSTVLSSVAQSEHSIMDCTGGGVGALSGGSAGGAVSARQLFLESLHEYPWNWSCWLELAKLCVADKQPLPTWQDIAYCSTSTGNIHTGECAATGTATASTLSGSMSAGALPGGDSSSSSSGGGDGCIDGNGAGAAVADWECAKVMYACFLIHAYLEKHCGDLAMQVIESTVLPILPNSLVLHAQVGLARYTLRQYDAAEDAFAGVRAADPYRLQGMDTYSNILYVKEKRAELSCLAHAIVEVEKFCPESCCVVGNYYSLKGQHERAVTYFQRAIRLNSNYLSAWTLMGHEYMELRNTAAAVQCYRNAVDISEVDYRAWYGLGQTYEMLHLYQYAHFYYRKAAYLRPFDARMWGAVGNCMLKLGMKEQAILSFERAVGCGDQEGIATRDLARLCREEGQSARAAEFYFRFLQISRFFDAQDGTDAGGAAFVTDTGAAEEKSGAARAHLSSKSGAVTTAGSADTSVASNAALLGALLNGGAAAGGGAHIAGAANGLGAGMTGMGMDSGLGLGIGLGARVVADAEQAEALLFLAVYHRSIGDLPLAQQFCTRLQGFMGPEGEEARVLLRAITSALHQLQQNQQAQSTAPAPNGGGVGVAAGASRAHRASPSPLAAAGNSNRGGISSSTAHHTSSANNNNNDSFLSTGTAGTARTHRSAHSSSSSSRRQSGFLTFGSSPHQLPPHHRLAGDSSSNHRAGDSSSASFMDQEGEEEEGLAPVHSQQSLQRGYDSLSLTPNAATTPSAAAPVGDNTNNTTRSRRSNNP